MNATATPRHGTPDRANWRRRWENIIPPALPAAGSPSPWRALPRIGALAGIAGFSVLWGIAVVVAGMNALYLCVSAIACVFILRDFRIGVVLLILLMPVSRSQIFPHAMFGLTGLNPLNLLLLGTLGAWLLQGLSGRTLRHFLPRPILWLYIVPILIAGILGARHVDQIARDFYVYEMLEFTDAAGYLRDRLVKPLFLVLFALLVGAAAARSEKSEKLLIPGLISVWVMGALVVVFVLRSGAGLDTLSGTYTRTFLSPLGLHANDLGRLYAIAYALLLFTWAEATGAGRRALLLASMGLIVCALVLTFSRGAFFGFAVVNLLFLFWRRSVRTPLWIALGSAVVLLALPAAVFDRMAVGFGGGLNAISAGRVTSIWLPLLPEFMASPLFGSGLGSILWSEPMRRGAGTSIMLVTHPHNAYLQALLDVGIVGLLVLGLYFRHVWKRLRALARNPQLSPTMRGFYLGAAAGLASFLISAVSDSSLTPVPEQVFLWLAIGMMIGQRLPPEAGAAGAMPPAGRAQPQQESQP